MIIAQTCWRDLESCVRCPACRTPAIETDVACRQCGFSLEAADRAFGIPPHLTPPLADLAGVLGAFERKRALRVIQQVERRFPQLTIAAVLTEVPEQTPLSTYAFWLFNRGQLTSAVEKGGDNRLVMLLIDTGAAQAATMLGYGLEPFVQETRLQSCLQAARQALLRGHHGQAIEAFTRELDRQLSEVCQMIPKQFGLVEDRQWLDSSADDESALESADSLY